MTIEKMKVIAENLEQSKKAISKGKCSSSHEDVVSNLTLHVKIKKKQGEENED